MSHLWRYWSGFLALGLAILILFRQFERCLELESRLPNSRLQIAAATVIVRRSAVRIGRELVFTIFCPAIFILTCPLLLADCPNPLKSQLRVSGMNRSEKFGVALSIPVLASNVSAKEHHE